MNGILAQAAALAAHAKASRVDARAGGDAEYWKHHSTFKYVKSVNFGVRRRRLFRTAFETVATEPSEWLARFPDVPAGEPCRRIEAVGATRRTPPRTKSGGAA